MNQVVVVAVTAQCSNHCLAELVGLRSLSVCRRYRTQGSALLRTGCLSASLPAGPRGSTNGGSLESTIRVLTRNISVRAAGTRGGSSPAPFDRKSAVPVIADFWYPRSREHRRAETSRVSFPFLMELSEFRNGNKGCPGKAH